MLRHVFREQADEELDVVRRPVDVLEPALNGPDTAARLKTVWQAKVFALPPEVTAADAECAGALADLRAATASSGALDARTDPGQGSPDPCQPSPGSPGFQGPENQLYRVEIHQGGDRTQARFN